MKVKKNKAPQKFIGTTIAVFCLVSYLSCGHQNGKEANEDKLEIQEDLSIQDSSLFTYDSTFNEHIPIPTKKINKKNLVVKEWNTNISTNIRVLDHVTTYNADGKKMEEIEYNSEGLKWRERYDYDARGNKIRELVYNANNKLVYVKKYRYNEYGKKEMTLTYNSQGKLIAIKNYEYIVQ